MLEKKLDFFLYNNMESFKNLGIEESILKVIEEHKFEKPSEIQEKSIPVILEGKNVIAGSATGSGKTLAFGVDLIQTSEPGKGIQSLVLVPTRELAEQVSKFLIRFSKFKELNIAAVYGGVGINPQIRDLENAEIVVGTPGRVLDHLNRRTMNLENLKVLVLDEADRMLDMGFRDDMDKIINECPIRRQTLLFSATISNDIMHLAKKYMKDFVEISAESHVDPTKLKQTYFDVSNHMKFSLLVQLLQEEKSGVVMVFCNTRKNVDFIAKNLMFSGIDALAIHGGLSQEKRNKIMEHFHSKKANILVCTDVAARGLDIKGITHVYNYDIPADPKEYVHRVGRTARAGKEGKAINLVSERDYENFSAVLNRTGLKIENEPTPEIHMTRIRWMPQPKRGRFNSRGGSREHQNRGRDSRGGHSRGPSRGSSRGGHSRGRSNYSRGPRR